MLCSKQLKAALETAIEIDSGAGDVWMLDAIARYPAPSAEAAFGGALDAQSVELLKAGAVSAVKARFGTIAGSGAALELYARLARERIE